MIRQLIKDRIKDLDLTQKRVSEFVGEHEQNLSSFTTGLRQYPYPKFIALLTALGLTVGPADAYVGEYAPDNIKAAVEAAIKAKGKTRKEVAQGTGVNESTLSLFLGGKRPISVNNLEKLMIYLDLSLISFNSPLVMTDAA